MRKKDSPIVNDIKEIKNEDKIEIKGEDKIIKNFDNVINIPKIENQPNY